LLFAAAKLALREKREWSVEVEGAIASAGYLQLTRWWLERAGFGLKEEGSRFRVIAGDARNELPPIPFDWSGAAYLLLIAWRSGGRVRCDWSDAPHPDREILPLLESVGLSLQVESAAQSEPAVQADGSGQAASKPNRGTPLDSARGDREALRVSGAPRAGLRASAERCPDLIPTLAALACVLPEPSRFDAVSILRSKESNRLEATLRMVRSVGAHAQLDGDRLTVEPSSRRPEFFELDSGGDHRMAMAAATLCVLLGARARISNSECVVKSFPDFWEQLRTTAALDFEG
jgi:3-phosphoshikimate 1-carboxyvinyltransferase